MNKSTEPKTETVEEKVGKLSLLDSIRADFGKLPKKDQESFWVGIVAILIILSIVGTVGVLTFVVLALAFSGLVGYVVAFIVVYFLIFYILFLRKK